MPDPRSCMSRYTFSTWPKCRGAHAPLRADHEAHDAPQVVVVDEIGTAQEVAAVKGSAQRGIVFIGTAHGVALANLIANPDLNALVGGTQSVILSDAVARRGAQC